MPDDLPLTAHWAQQQQHRPFCTMTARTTISPLMTRRKLCKPSRKTPWLGLRRRFPGHEPWGSHSSTCLGLLPSSVDRCWLNAANCACSCCVCRAVRCVHADCRWMWWDGGVQTRGPAGRKSVLGWCYVVCSPRPISLHFDLMDPWIRIMCTCQTRQAHKHTPHPHAHHPPHTPLPPPFVIFSSWQA